MDVKRALIWMGILYMVVTACFFVWKDIQPAVTNQQYESETVLTFEVNGV